MQSKWFESKGNALRLRKQGLSLRAIEQKLGVPKSTLSGWFKNVNLSTQQRKKLFENWQDGLVKARKHSALWHNHQKQKRLEKAQMEASQVLGSLDLKSIHLQELALAILYLGEGKKASEETSLGSSDPLILKFFLELLKSLYKIDLKRVHCALFLRADQDEAVLKCFWADALNLSIETFTRVYKDKRTIGSQTYPHYKGVCSVGYGDVSIKRRLMFLSQMFCKKTIEGACSSVG